MALLLLSLLIADVRRGLLVDAVVCQVGEQILHLRALVGVLVRSKPHEPVIIQIQPKGVDGGHQQVQAEVKLGLVDEVRPGDISEKTETLFSIETDVRSPLYYERPGVGDLAPLVDDLDALPPGQGRRLHDPPALPSLPLPDLPEQLRVRREAKCPGQEVELRLSMF